MSNGNHMIDLDYSDGPEGEIDWDAYDEEEVIEFEEQTDGD